MIHNDSDIPKDEWDHIEDTLQKSKYYLHEGSQTMLCRVGVYQKQG